MVVEGRVLGPMEVVLDGRRVAIGGERQRACLLLLLLARGAPVSADALADELWGEERPASERASLQMHISRLRRALGNGDGVVRSVAGGYALSGSVELDVDRFDAMLASARQAGAEERRSDAARALSDALEIWRGPALCGAGDGPRLRAEALRLEELRRSARLDLAELEIAAGRAAHVVAEVRGLSADDPLDERAVRVLMLALAGSGRHAEALAAFQRARRRLVDELGIEPGPELHRLNAELLRREAMPAAAASVQGAGAATPAPAPRGRDIRVRRAALAAAAVLLVIAVAVAAVTTRARAPVHVPSAGGVVVLDGRDGSVRSTSPISPRAVDLVVAGGAPWVATASDASLVRMSTGDARMRERIPVSGSLDALAAGFGWLWVADGAGGVVRRIDPATGRVFGTTRVGAGPTAMTAGDGSVWVLNGGDSTLNRLDRDGRRIGTVSIGPSPSALALAAGAVWVADDVTGTVSAYDERTLALGPVVAVGQQPRALAVAGGALWSANALDGTASRIDPRHARVVATVPIGRGVASLAAGSQGLWAADPRHAGVALVDPRRGVVVRRARLGARVTLLAADGPRLWAVVAPPPARHRGGTLTLAGYHTPLVRYPGDPAVNYSGDSDAVHAITNDGLLTYRRVAGAAGTRIVPDLAAALPVARDGGSTITFRLRRGVRFSDGRPVRASDAAATIVRVYRMHPLELNDVLPLGIAGERTCLARPRSCRRVLGVRADDAAGTITLRLRGDARALRFALAAPLFSVLPAGTPARPLRRPPFPATGPYRISALSPTSVVLERNPFFRAWSEDAQPPGYPDRIVWRYRMPARAALHAVWSGRADVAWSDMSDADVERSSRQHPTRDLAMPYAAVEFFALDTRRGVFADARVRRAVALAADRRRLAGALGPPVTTPVLCHVIPAGYPGSRPGCPDDPMALLKARALVAGAGARDRVVTLLVPPRHTPARATAAFASMLRTIGLRARLKRSPPDIDAYYGILTDARRRPDAAWAHWYMSGAPDPAQFFTPLLGCRDVPSALHLTGWCDPALDRQVSRAGALAASDPAAAARTWAAADRRVLSTAPVIPFASLNVVAPLAPRVGNPIAHWRYGALLSQMWVR